MNNYGKRFNVHKKSNGLHIDKRKYYTEDEFFKDGGELDRRINVLLDNWDDTPQEVAYANAKKSIIKMLEDKYMDLEMEIDNCQGAMSNLNEAFAELDIYKFLVKRLGGNIDLHKRELVDEWFKKHNKHSSDIKPITLKLQRKMNDIGDYHRVLNELCDAVEIISKTTNEIIKKLH